MRNVEWSSDALADFDDIVSYINNENPVAASKMADRILNAIDNLADFPTGHQGRVVGTYEKLVQKTAYIVAYSIGDRAVYILRIIHGARDWPEGEWPAE
jgi:addiction module RelE/StbE family toxin